MDLDERQQRRGLVFYQDKKFDEKIKNCKSIFFNSTSVEQKVIDLSIYKRKSFYLK